MAASLLLSQVAAQASEAERLLAKSIAERSELQARYLALGSKLDLIVRGDATSAQRIRQARKARLCGALDFQSRRTAGLWSLAYHVMCYTLCIWLAASALTVFSCNLCKLTPGPRTPLHRAWLCVHIYALSGRWCVTRTCMPLRLSARCEACGLAIRKRAARAAACAAHHASVVLPHVDHQAQLAMLVEVARGGHVVAAAMRGVWLGFNMRRM